MTSRWRWIGVIAAATGIDLVLRFLGGFDFRRVMHGEAVLFPLTGLALARLLQTDPRTHGWRRALRLGLVWLFCLGGLRPLLWTLGLPLLVANLATLAVPVVAVPVWLLRRRRAFRAEGEQDRPAIPG